MTTCNNRTNIWFPRLEIYKLSADVRDWLNCEVALDLASCHGFVVLVKVLGLDNSG